MKGYSKTKISWEKSYRIIPSIYPPITLFERVADPKDLEAIYQLEALTNDRLRDQVGDLSLVKPEDRISGVGTSPIMATFTHLNPAGSRFSDGTYGIYYAAKSETTARAETIYHRSKFLAATNEKPIEITMRLYVATVKGELHDLRNIRSLKDEIYHPSDYSVSQKVGKELYSNNSNGIVYNSVRDSTGQCVAAFKPKIISNCKQSKHLRYCWDGKRISSVFEIKA